MNLDGLIMKRPGELRITVPGTPIGKPRMTRRDKWKKRPCVMRYRSWCDVVRLIVGNVLPPADTVTKLDWTATFEPPKSWSKKKKLASIGELHRPVPDRDNIDKAVLDCLYKKDSSIAAGCIKKLWGHKAELCIVIRFDDTETGD